MGMQQNTQRQSPIETAEQQNQKLLAQQPMSPSDKQQLQVKILYYASHSSVGDLHWIQDYFDKFSILAAGINFNLSYVCFSDYDFILRTFDEKK